MEAWRLTLERSLEELTARAEFLAARGRGAAGEAPGRGDGPPASR
jgi:hypothetical protein